ncbi:hypothetical protein DUHN55_32050 [Helicobacter pylori]
MQVRGAGAWRSGGGRGWLRRVALGVAIGNAALGRARVIAVGGVTGVVGAGDALVGNAVEKGAFGAVLGERSCGDATGRVEAGEQREGG